MPKAGDDTAPPPPCPSPGGKIGKFLRRKRKGLQAGIISFLQAMSPTGWEGQRHSVERATAGNASPVSTFSSNAEPGLLSRGMWRGVEKACGWKHPRAPSVIRLFDDERPRQS